MERSRQSQKCTCRQPPSIVVTQLEWSVCLIWGNTTHLVSLLPPSNIHVASVLCTCICTCTMYVISPIYMYMCLSRAFGHFEKPLFMELCKHVETKFVPSGAILFRPGQTDDSIYVVKNGLLKVYIIERVSSC